MRTNYIHHIEGLREELMHLGSAVEEVLIRAIHTLETRNQAAALWIIENDSQIDEARRNLEERAIKLLATQQPVVATDLRLVSVVSSVATELERIGDYATTIARRVYRAPDHNEPLKLPPDITKMTQLVVQMLHTSLEAFLQQDATMAREMCQRDDEVDAMEDSLNTQIIQMIEADPQSARAAVDMLDVVHALERTADRATNIGERVIYLVTNVTEELNE